MTRPTRFLIRMVIFLAIVALGIAALTQRLSGAFLANPLLNGMILGVLLLGVV